MLLQIKEILDKKKNQLTTLFLVGVLFAAFSPLVSAVAQISQEHIPASTFSRADSATEIERTENLTIVSATKVKPHCLSMAQGSDCDNVVCSPALAHLFQLAQVSPIIETKNSLAPTNFYLITLPTEIRPPKLSSV